MSALLNSAPQLQPERTDQIAALPLGGRIKVDPWSDRIELVKTEAGCDSDVEREDAF